MGKKKSGWSRETRKPRPTFTKSEKTAVLKRDKRVCYVCGGPKADEVDHVVPLAEGGAHTLDNAAAIHRQPCHLIKSRAESQRGYERRQARLKLPPEPRPFDFS